MAHRLMMRDDAPFGAETWKRLDDVMIAAARSQLVGRRMLHVNGPHGLGLRAVTLADEERRDEEQRARLITTRVLPLHYIHRTFSLDVRDLAAHEREGVLLDTRAVASAAIDAARLEDDLIFNGAPGVPGLTGIEGAHHRDLAAWTEVGDAVDDLIQAVTMLDEAGFHGPYTLGLSPDRYNLLFRRYRNGNQTEIEHLRLMVTDGIYKAPVLRNGGVLLASGPQYASLVLGQDLTIGFIGPDDRSLVFSLSESLALWVARPQAVAVLEGGAAGAAQ